MASREHFHIITNIVEEPILLTPALLLYLIIITFSILQLSDDIGNIQSK